MALTFYDRPKPPSMAQRAPVRGSGGPPPYPVPRFNQGTQPMPIPTVDDLPQPAPSLGSMSNPPLGEVYPSNQYMGGYVLHNGSYKPNPNPLGPYTDSDGVTRQGPMGQALVMMTNPATGQVSWVQDDPSAVAAWQGQNQPAQTPGAPGSGLPGDPTMGWSSAAIHQNAFYEEQARRNAIANATASGYTEKGFVTLPGGQVVEWMGPEHRAAMSNGSVGLADYGRGADYMLINGLSNTGGSLGNDQGGFVLGTPSGWANNLRTASEAGGPLAGLTALNQYLGSDIETRADGASLGDPNNPWATEYAGNAGGFIQGLPSWNEALEMAKRGDPTGIALATQARKGMWPTGDLGGEHVKAAPNSVSGGPGPSSPVTTLGSGYANDTSLTHIRGVPIADYMAALATLSPEERAAHLAANPDVQQAVTAYEAGTAGANYSGIPNAQVASIPPGSVGEVTTGPAGPMTVSEEMWLGGFVIVDAQGNVVDVGTSIPASTTVRVYRLTPAELAELTAPAMASGGYTTAPVFMTGDARGVNPAAGGAKPEMVYNPTRAPIMVANHEQTRTMMPRFANGTGGDLWWKGMNTGLTGVPPPPTWEPEGPPATPGTPAPAPNPNDPGVPPGESKGGMPSGPGFFPNLTPPAPWDSQAIASWLKSPQIAPLTKLGGFGWWEGMNNPFAPQGTATNGQPTVPGPMADSMGGMSGSASTAAAGDVPWWLDPKYNPKDPGTGGDTGTGGGETYDTPFGGYSTNPYSLDFWRQPNDVIMALFDKMARDMGWTPEVPTSGPFTPSDLYEMFAKLIPAGVSGFNSGTGY